MDEYTLDKYKSGLALGFIINSYLVAVGFRPLFFSDTWSLDVQFWEKVISDTKYLFPQLTFYRNGNFTYVHHPLLLFDADAISDKELGALLNFIDFVDLNNKAEYRSSVGFICEYRNAKDIPIPILGYIIHGSTQVSQVTNKVVQLRLLLKNINVNVYARVDPS